MNCLHVPKIMIPKEGTDLYKWSVVACDQYTSQPEYWEKTEEIVQNAPSTLRLTLPEVYLEKEDEADRVKAIHACMENYMKEGILQELEEGFILVKRDFGKEYARNGLIVEIDLETYEYRKGEKSLVRPTEMTVEERIPPRLRVRQTATLEIPHIMLLIDDPEESVIEPLMKQSDMFSKVYDTDLMQNGGHITGYFIPKGNIIDTIMERIENLADPAIFAKKYGLTKNYPLLNFAVGDGNHSMATAKAAWENIKKNLTPEEQRNHPARFCLCEIVNIHDKSLEVEPIHRVLFNVDKKDLISEANAFFQKHGCELSIEQNSNTTPYANENEHCFTFCAADGDGVFKVSNPVWGIAVASLQTFLDEYLAKHTESKIDYIHGIDVVRALGSKEGNIGFFLPDIEKNDLFKGVIVDGVLPRKTFSMGEAQEKRYYMECKKITTKM